MLSAFHKIICTRAFHLNPLENFQMKQKVKRVKTFVTFVNVGFDKKHEKNFWNVTEVLLVLNHRRELKREKRQVLPIRPDGRRICLARQKLERWMQWHLFVSALFQLSAFWTEVVAVVCRVKWRRRPEKLNSNIWFRILQFQGRFNEKCTIFGAKFEWQDPWALYISTTVPRELNSCCSIGMFPVGQIKWTTCMSESRNSVSVFFQQFHRDEKWNDFVFSCALKLWEGHPSFRHKTCSH